MNSNLTTEHTSFSTELGGVSGEAETRLDIKRTLRQNIWLIFGVGLALAIPSMIVIGLTTEPEFVAKAQLQFAAATPGVMSEKQDNSRNYQGYVATQLAFINGPILQQVLEDPLVREIPGIYDSPDPKEFLSGKLGTQSKRGSELLTLSMRMLEREHAIYILDLIIDEYMAVVAKESSDSDTNRFGIISSEVTNLEGQLNNRNESIKVAHEGLGAFQPDGKGGVVLQDPVTNNLAQAVKDVSNHKSTLRQAEMEIAVYEEAVAGFKENPQDPIYKLGIYSAVNNDIEVASIEQDLVALESTLNTLRYERQPGHVKLEIMEDELASKKKLYEEKKLKVRAEKLEERGAQLNEVLSAASIRLNEAEAHRDEIEKSRDDMESKRENAAKHALDLRRLNDERDDIRERIKSYNRTLDKIDLEQRAPARVKRVSDASASSKPDKGKLLQLLVLALGGSFGVGLALAFLRELTNTHARSASDLAGVTALPILASIPDTNAERFPEDLHVPLLCADFPHSPTADEYRRVLARMVYPPDDTIEVNSCMITSPTRGDGKTSVACNMAVTLASANRSVILIDICPRDPAVELNFGLEPSEGLAEAIREDATVENLARSTEFANLRVLGPGLQADFLKGKLASREMMDILEHLEHEYDHVIIDTPPALLMSDAKLLAPVVDAVVVVVGSGVSTLGMIRRCLRELDQENANLIGVIMNRVRPVRGGYMQNNLDLFYHYSDTVATEAVLREFPAMKMQDDDEMAPAFVLLPDEEESEDR